MSLNASDLFTAPWPGPGDSEGPVDPEPSIVSIPTGSVVSRLRPEAGPLELVSTASWPGPGDSEGPVYSEAEAAPENTSTHRSREIPPSSFTRARP
jgi:hypothetical protein